MGDAVPKERGQLVRALAVIGTVLAWLPIVFTLLASLAGSARAGRLRFDYLLPAELAPVVLLGGLLLVVAAALCRRRRAPLGWSLGIALAALVAMSVVAVATGLASGAIEPEGLPLLAVNGLLGLYVLAVVALGVTGLRLVGDVYRKVPTD